MSHPNSSEHYINVDNRPTDGILKNLEEFSITVPLHSQHISLKINHNHSDDVNLIKSSLALHVGLSIVECILLRCDCIAYWLKDHFYPQHNVLFKNEIILTKEKQQEILNILQDVEKWPGIIFKDNREIRQMLHTRKSSTNGAYGLCILNEQGGENIFINLQLIQQAAKASKQVQVFYAVMIGVKLLHEFSHFIYSKYGRSHLLNTYGIQLKDSIHTPNGVLRGESGNRFEELMLGFVLLHAGHANIPMNIKMCLGQSTLADHLRIIEPAFITKLVKKETYEVNQMTSNFLHYSELEFCSLERFSFDKAADLQAFYPDSDDGPLQRTPYIPFSLSDDDIKQDNDASEEEEKLTAFVSLPDKIVL